MDLQETGRKNITIKTQPSEANHHTKIETLHKTTLKRKQRKKEN